MREGLRPAEREALYADDRRMYAYYFGFDPTGVPEVDAILSAVAYAGKGFHGTEDWGNGTSRFGDDRPYGDVIQAAANEAANRWDHTAAIAEAAREYVRTRRAHLDHGPLLSARKAAHDALIAAVDAERAEREPGCTCVRCAPNYHLMRGCPTCGNKRCPKVADHDNRCTGSNEPGQIPNPQP